MTVDRHERLAELRQQAADESGLSLDHDSVVSLAALRFSREEILSRLVDGGSDPARLSEALQTNAEAIQRIIPPPQQAVELIIVSKAETQLCPECGTEFATQKTHESLEQRQAKARLEQSRQAALQASSRKNTPIEPTATPSPANAAAKLIEPKSEVPKAIPASKPVVNPSMDAFNASQGIYSHGAADGGQSKYTDRGANNGTIWFSGTALDARPLNTSPYPLPREK